MKQYRDIKQYSTRKPNDAYDLKAIFKTVPPLHKQGTEWNPKRPDREREE
jgi:hypothetical protein